MPLVLELTPEQERELRAEAARSGVPVTEFVVRQILSRSRDRLPAGISGREFVERAAGLIPPDELDRMEKAVEAGCEGVDPDE